MANTPKPSDFFENHFFPASFDDPKRDVPPLPDYLPPLPKDETPAAVAKQDLETGDNWVHRNPNLIRLTGDHPFNCEAPLGTLFNAGFFTPTHLHYVRNHGAVPPVTKQDALKWTIRIHGLVEKEETFTLQQLSEKFAVVSIPVTLVCAGNRRKEQNAVRKTIGFNWGAAGVSTALWTGVYLADILEHVKPRRGEAKHVVFEGGDSLLRQEPYGTSQRLCWAANKDKGMLIAWAMNHLPLEPDHGFPVRLIVPGQIGGRSVKWLKRIEISARESQHHYHFRDNKILPTQFTVEQANAEENDHLWKDPRYIITELNVNSVVARPNHNEKITINTKLPKESVPFYTIRGYAYAGGGRRVTRVEVSLDEGQSWELGEIEYPEDRFRERRDDSATYGALDLTHADASFCWCFWSYNVSHDILRNCNTIMVRAMDEGSALQQRDMYWHALGMMNNCWFCVAVHTERVTDKEIELRFEHPTLAGEATGGWMEGMGEKELEVPLTKPDIKREITLEELADHSKDEERPWIVVNGEVYDVTDYLKDHPGGGGVISNLAGQDASKQFLSIHSATAKRILAGFHIGTLQGRAPGDGGSSTNSFDNTWRTVKLVKKEMVNHDTVLCRFSLPAERPLELPVGQHVFLRLRRKDIKRVVQRAYTPVSPGGGTIDFLIKLYLPLPSPGFRGGKMTMGIHRLLLGDEIDLSDPYGHFSWEKQSNTAKWTAKENGNEIEMKVKQMGLICGGSGITPILQVLRSIFDKDVKRELEVRMISANTTEDDILCRLILDGLAKDFSDHFKLHYVLSKPPVLWPFSRGRINEDILKAHMPGPSEHGLILACGPDGMIESLKRGLVNLGWDITKSLFVF